MFPKFMRQEFGHPIHHTDTMVITFIQEVPGAEWCAILVHIEAELYRGTWGNIDEASRSRRAAGLTEHYKGRTHKDIKLALTADGWSWSNEKVSIWADNS